MFTDVRVVMLKVEDLHLFSWEGGSSCRPISNMHTEIALFCGKYLDMISYSQKYFPLCRNLKCQRMESLQHP